MKFLRCETVSILRNGIEETSDEHRLPVSRYDRVGVRHVADGQTFRPILHFPWCFELTVSAGNREGRVSIRHYLALLTHVGHVHPVVDPGWRVQGELEAE